MNTIQNSVRLIGHVGGDPEIKELPSGEKMAKFNIATNRVFQDAKGELVKETSWHRIVFFGRNVKVIEDYVTKGKQVGIEGRLATRSYDAPDGTKRYITEVICNDVMLLTPLGASVPNPFESEVEADTN